MNIHNILYILLFGAFFIQSFEVKSSHFIEFILHILIFRLFCGLDILLVIGCRLYLFKLYSIISKDKTVLVFIFCLLILNLNVILNLLYDFACLGF